MIAAAALLAGLFCAQVDHMANYSLSRRITFPIYAAAIFLLLALALRAGRRATRDSATHPFVYLANASLAILLVSGANAFLSIEYYFGLRGMLDSIRFHLTTGNLLSEHGGNLMRLIVLKQFLLNLLVLVPVLIWLRRRSLRFCLFATGGMGALLAGVGVSLQADGATSQEKVELAKYFAQPVVTPAKKKNLIYIFAESLEYTYADPAFGGAIKPVLDLAKHGLLARNVGQLGENSWTISGMVAAMCGVPVAARGLFSAHDGNKLDDAERFLPNARCLGDILKDSGYQLSFLGGASLKFAGKGAFLQQHGFQRTFGREELTSPTSPTSDWGLYDAELFQAAAREIQDLKGKGQPYALVLLTLDTHHPTGYPSKECGTLSSRDPRDILYSVECSSRMIANFVGAHLNEVVRGETVIVIASDHLAMKNNRWKDLEARPRKNLVLMLDGNRAVNDKVALTIDIFPTLLRKLGLTVESGRSGLGVDMESRTPSLASLPTEKTASIARSDALARQLWTAP